LKKEKSSMAVITRLAVHLVAKNLPLTSKEAAVVFGLVIGWLDLPGLTEPAAHHKGLQWFVDW